MEFSLSEQEYNFKEHKPKKNYFKFLRPIQSFSLHYGGFISIVTLCSFTFFFLDLFLRDSALQHIVLWGALFTPVGHIDFYRFITAVFLHSGFLHFASNMFMCYYLCSHISKYWDNRKVFLVFFWSAVLANGVALLIRNFKHVSITSMGASGGVFALIGGFIAILMFNRSISRNMVLLYKKTLLPIIILNFFLGLIIHEIDFLNHLLGCAIGFIIGFFIEKLPYQFYQFKHGFWSFLWLISTLIIIISFIYATIIYWNLLP